MTTLLRCMARTALPALEFALLAIGLVALPVDVAFAQTSTECGVPGGSTLSPPCTHSWVTTAGFFGQIGDVSTGATSATATTFSGDTETANTSFNSTQVNVRSTSASGGPRGESRFLDAFQVVGGPTTGTVTFYWRVVGQMDQFARPTACDQDPLRDGTEFFVAAVGRTLTSQFLSLCALDSRTIDRSGSFSVTFTQGVPFIQGLTLHGEAPNGVVSLSAQFTAIDLPAGATLVSASNTAYNVVQPSPTALLTSLAALVQNLNMSKGLTNSFDAKLQNALQALVAAQSGDVNAACNQIAAFVNEVAAQTGNALTTTQAAQLTLQAQNVRLSLGCR